MRCELTEAEIAAYRRDGFVVVDGFLDADELERWRAVFDSAVDARRGRRFSDAATTIESDIDDAFYSRVFEQLVNLWQTDSAMRDLILDERIGRMAATLADVDGVRVWHDQALIKQPFGNPTAFHLDVPYWSFTSDRAISIWIALDDATEANGCLYFVPGSHRETSEENVGIGPNVGAIFEVYPNLAGELRSGAMRAGDCSFHNGMTIHGAGANMTVQPRRAMTCAFMPDGCVFNGRQNILTDAQVAGLQVGDLLADPRQNPIVYPSGRGTP